MRARKSALHSPPATPACSRAGAERWINSPPIFQKPDDADSGNLLSDPLRYAVRPLWHAMDDKLRKETVKTTTGDRDALCRWICCSGSAEKHEGLSPHGGESFQGLAPAWRARSDGMRRG